MQKLLDMVFDKTCLTCDTRVETAGALCGACWRETPFVTGLVCDKCGTPLPGEDAGGPEYCDDCLTLARPWSRGRAALVYKDNGRKLVLALKHGDRTDLARPLGGWMARAARGIVPPGALVAPVPLNRWRLLSRRYNQSAELARVIASELALSSCPDLLQRPRRTPTQDGRDRDGRFANVAGAIRVHPARKALLAGRDVVLVDDVMTSGATLAAAADACHAAGAREVFVLVLARVAKDA